MNEWINGDKWKSEPDRMGTDHKAAKEAKRQSGCDLSTVVGKNGLYVLCLSTQCNTLSSETLETLGIHVNRQWERVWGRVWSLEAITFSMPGERGLGGKPFPPHNCSGGWHNLGSSVEGSDMQGKNGHDWNFTSPWEQLKNISVRENCLLKMNWS